MWVSGDIRAFYIFDLRCSTGTESLMGILLSRYRWVDLSGRNKDTAGIRGLERPVKC